MKNYPVLESKQSIFPLLWVMLFDHASLNIAFPILTLLFFDVQSRLFQPETSAAVRSMWYGLCVAIPHVVNIIMTPVLSALSDEFGRKRLLILGTIGAFLFAMTAAFGVLLGSLTLLFLGRIIQGAFSRTNPIAQAAIGDIASKENKVIYMGYLQTAISLGAFLGPIIGGYFANQYFFSTLNFSLPYFVAALLGAIATFITVFYFKETATLEGRQSVSWSGLNRQTLKKVVSNKQVINISAVLLLSQISWSLYYQYIPPILKTVFHYDAHVLGIFVGMIAFWLALATTFGIKSLRAFLTFRQLLVFSVWLILVGLLLNVLFCFLPLSGFYLHFSFLIWIAAIPTAIGDVIAYSCLTTLYSNSVEKNEQGQVMAICFIVISLIWALTGVIGGMLMSSYRLLPMILAPVGIVFAILILHSKRGKELN